VENLGQGVPVVGKIPEIWALRAFLHFCLQCFGFSPIAAYEFST
jgi:hypothetical protein